MLIATKKFDSEIVLERSITPVVQNIGIYHSIMELFYFPEDNLCHIDWEIEDYDSITMEIELEDDTKNVTGYDGVFELPEQAIELLKENGFNTEEVEL